MKKLTKIMGTFFLSIAALIISVGPASISGYAVEEIPKSIKNNR